MQAPFIVQQLEISLAGTVHLSEKYFRVARDIQRLSLTVIG